MAGLGLRESTGALHLIRLGPHDAEPQAPVVCLQLHGLTMKRQNPALNHSVLSAGPYPRLSRSQKVALKASVCKEAKVSWLATVETAFTGIEYR